MSALLTAAALPIGYILGAIHTQRRLRDEIERKHEAIREEFAERSRLLVEMFELSQTVDKIARDYCVSAARAAGRREAEYEAAQKEKNRHVH